MKRSTSFIRWVFFYVLVLTSQVFLITYVPSSLSEEAKSRVDVSDTVKDDTKDFEDTKNDQFQASYEKLFTTDSGTPSYPDVSGELRMYFDRIVDGMEPSLEAISARQQHTTTKHLKLDQVVHATGTPALLEMRLFFIQYLYRISAAKRDKEAVAIATTVQHDANSVESAILPWIQYHVEMGIAKFYIFYDGEDLSAVHILSHEALKGIVDVMLVKQHLGASDDMINRYTFFDKMIDPNAEGNKRLMKKQKFGVDQAIAKAHNDGQTWIIQIDVDELFLPSGHDSIPAALNNVPPDVPAVRFMNFESQAEAGDITDPFLQINLFRIHMYFTTPEGHAFRSKVKQGLNTGFLYLYANGKSAARLSADWDVSQFGPHYFNGNKDNWVNPISNDSFILHYCYTNPNELVRKAKRSCPKHFGKPALYEEVKNDCFILDADARAFMAANTGNAEAFFYQNFVYSEGAPVYCENDRTSKSGWCSLSDIAALKEMMIRIGLLKRFTLPQVILRRHEIEMSYKMMRRNSSTQKD